MALRQSRILLTAVICGLALVGVATTVTASVPNEDLVNETFSSDPSDSRPEPVERTVTPSATIAMGHPLNNVVVDADRVWIGSPTGITPIDPATNEVGSEITVNNVAGFFAFGFEAAWVSDYNASVVRRVDPATGRVLAEIEVGPNPEGIAVTDDAVWVANHTGGSLSRIDPATNTVVTTLEVGPAGRGGPAHILEADGVLWVSFPIKGTVLTVDTASNTISEIVTSGDPCGEMAFVNTQLWVAGCGGENSIYVIDRAKNEEVAVVQLDGQAGAAFTFDDRVWIPEGGSGGPGRLVAIGPTFEIDDAIAVEASEYSAATGFDSIWIANWRDGTVMRFDATAGLPVAESSGATTGIEPPTT